MLHSKCVNSAPATYYHVRAAYLASLVLDGNADAILATETVIRCRGVSSVGLSTGNKHAWAKFFDSFEWRGSPESEHYAAMLLRLEKQFPGLGGAFVIIQRSGCAQFFLKG